MPAVAFCFAILAIALVAPFGFKPNWELTDGYAQWVMAVASVGSLTVSAIALVAVAGAYNQSREANQLTRAQMHASTRPFLKIAEVTLHEHTSPDGNYNWWVTAGVENASEFPATDVSMTFVVRKRPLVIGSNSTIWKLCKDYAAAPDVPSTLVLARSQTTLMELGNDDLPEQGAPRGLLLSLAIRYRSVTNPDFYVLGAAYHIGSIADLFGSDEEDDERSHTAGLIAETQVAT